MKKQKNNQLTVIKSNYLIEASYRLTLQEQRVILFLASMVKPEDEDFCTYRIYWQQFAEVAGLENNKDIYGQAREITKRLLSRTLEIWNPFERSLLQVNWLSSSKYVPGEGYVDLKFSPDLKPYMLGLKERFTKYCLKDVIQMKSTYAVRIYELLKQYAAIGERTLTIAELKKHLGISQDEYKLYGDFKRKVILVAQREMNRRADIAFDFQEIKSGRRIESLQFLIRSNARLKKRQNGESPARDDLYEKMVNYFCISCDDAARFLKDFDRERIHKALEYVQERYQKGKIEKSSLGGYASKAVKEGYELKESRFDIEKKEKQSKEVKQKHEKEEKDRLTREYESYLNKMALSHKENLSSEELEKIEAEIMQQVKQKEGVNRFTQKFHFHLALTDYLSGLAGALSFDEWKSRPSSAL